MPIPFRRITDYLVQPEAAYFHQALGEFILPYEAVRTADDPDQTLLSFLQTTYELLPSRQDGIGARSNARKCFEKHASPLTDREE